MNKLLLTLMIGMFLISFASALDNQGVGKQGENFTFIQTCDDATYITLSTIQYPNRTVQIINENMTSMGGGAFQYNFTDVVNGRTDITGISDGCTKTFATFFIITPSGMSITSGSSMIYFILISGSLFLFVLCLWAGLILPFRNKRAEGGEILGIQLAKYPKVALLFLSYVFLVWLINLLIALSNSFNITQQYFGFFRVIFGVLNSFSYPLFVIMLIFIMTLAIKDFKLKNQLDQILNVGSKFR